MACALLLAFWPFCCRARQLFSGDDLCGQQHRAEHQADSSMASLSRHGRPCSLFITLFVHANYSACWCPREFLIARQVPSLIIRSLVLPFIYWRALGTDLTSASCSVRFTWPLTCAQQTNGEDKFKKLNELLVVPLAAPPNRF